VIRRPLITEKATEALIESYTFESGIRCAKPNQGPPLEEFFFPPLFR